MPPLAGFGTGMVLVGLVKIDWDDVTELNLTAVVSVRWHSFRMEGIDDAGRRDGIEKAWISVNMLDA